MIRFVDLGFQTGDKRQFAWFDTVTSRFREYNGEVVWDDWEDFVEGLADEDFFSRDEFNRLYRLYKGSLYGETDLIPPKSQAQTPYPLH